ncbi:methionine--tRNA ligase [Candidatus Rickettsiella viridis]|uniref:Methionine--tRNA ligase n=1 Tax=Candidatus Rickettsiella viridis TaxID=676208 RepID=A0A2Z5V6T9_9COXI|nr:methionine--tRNA ligase [Candidatus Rickettsiella viridis]BBB14637.1 methionine--tRNA ligase [Candidatus Rickettsiella viridis]
MIHEDGELSGNTAEDSSAKSILVTTALPYANGSIHLGHLLEHIQADIWVRFQKMLGRNCIFLSGEDAHGTPVMLAAKQRGIEPEELVKLIASEHKADLDAFHISFDNYYTTHSPENKALVELIYARMQAKGDIRTQVINQAYDPEAKMFLPDRYVKGNCPCCKTPDQYGDNCEACGSTYTPLDLIDPKSTLSGATPIAKESEHYFFQLSNYADFLRTWITSEHHLAEEVSNKLLEWFKEGLHDLDISRDTPYFGFKIPGTEDKYFYVWIDAPIGYMACFKNLCKRRPDLNFDEYWTNNEKVALYHFVGKDIINFHAIFWPAILKSADFRTPSGVFVHGYLTVNGQKMSKSRGTFITAQDYRQHLDPEYLRYYFAAKLNKKAEDIDLNLEDFTQRINADLVGKLVNIASRCASFISKRFDYKLSPSCHAPKLVAHFIEKGDEIAQAYENREFSRAIRTIMDLADQANQIIDAEKPWALVKIPEQIERAHAVCSLGLNLFRILMTYLKPVLPVTAEKVETFLNIVPMTWENRQELLCDHTIRSFTPLLQRIQEEAIRAIQNDALTATQNLKIE